MTLHFFANMRSASWEYGHFLTLHAMSLPFWQISGTFEVKTRIELNIA